MLKRGFSANAPICKLYHQGVDYLGHDFHFQFEDALYLLRELKNHRSRLSGDTPACSLNFYVESDGSLRSEIYSNNGLWADSEVDTAVATKNPALGFCSRGVRDVDTQHRPRVGRLLSDMRRNSQFDMMGLGNRMLWDSRMLLSKCRKRNIAVKWLHLLERLGDCLTGLKRPSLMSLIDSSNGGMVFIV